MNIISLVASRPVLGLISLAFLVLILPGIMLPHWYRANQSAKQNASWLARNLETGLVLGIEAASKSLHPSSSSAENFARVLGTSLKNTDCLFFPRIQAKVAPFLFQAYSTIPLVAHASYIGRDGLFFSFFTSRNQTLAMYANSTSTSDARQGRRRTWYLQKVEPNSGNLLGEAIETQPKDAAIEDYLQGVRNAADGIYAVLGTGLGEDKETLILNTIALEGEKGAATLGYPVAALTDFIGGTNFDDGSEAYLFTVGGQMLLGGSKDASLIFNSSLDCLHQLQNPPEADGSVKDHCRNLDGRTIAATELKLENSKYRLYSSVTNAAGLHLVYVLAVPQTELASLVTENFKWEVIVISLMAVATFVSIITFVCLMGLSAKREMHLRASLKDQTEATREAERKSENKSQALAKASHDIRASLAGISGLIELCYDSPPSEIESNLELMQQCTNDLLELLNSILDMSKIEAGRMQLEEEDFDLVQLLEDVVDSFYPVAMKKGMDVILDHHDGSTMKVDKIRGDRAKLRQILSNLLSNAVKFTSEGHITLKAWARKPSFASSVALASSQSERSKRFPWPSRKKDDVKKDDSESFESTRKNSNMLEFVFEVDDTGCGIPRETHKSIFENYVQVRETARGQQGTGLGLGIVQSLVRLMGGDIRIVEKETGQKGTCFRFNVFLATCDPSSPDLPAQSKSEAKGDSSLAPIRTSSPSLRIRNLSPRLNILGSSPKVDESQVALLIKNEERRRVAHNFLQKLGINATLVENWEHLGPMLQSIKSKLSSPSISTGRSESSSNNNTSGSGSKALPLRDPDGSGHIVPSDMRKGSLPHCILLIIDASAGPFSGLCSAIDQFRDGLHGAFCKVVLLNKPKNKKAHKYGITAMNEDLGFLKPLHGSRLIQVIKLLPEFGGTIQMEVPAMLRGERMPSNTHLQLDEDTEIQQIVTPENENSIDDENPKGKAISTSEAEHRAGKDKRKSSKHGIQSGKSELEGVRERDAVPYEVQGLRGKIVLVAEDNSTNAWIAKMLLLKLGTEKVDLCANGADALARVRQHLKELKEHGSSNQTLPYDYIFMDCQMPIMDGFEATKKIREEEKDYGFHTPIIALTAHSSSGEEAREIVEAGMDAHLTKPLNVERLMEAINGVHKA